MADFSSCFTGECSAQSGDFLRTAALRFEFTRYSISYIPPWLVLYSYIALLPWLTFHTLPILVIWKSWALCRTILLQKAVIVSVSLRMEVCPFTMWLCRNCVISQSSVGHVGGYGVWLDQVKTHSSGAAVWIPSNELEFEAILSQESPMKIDMCTVIDIRTHLFFLSDVVHPWMVSPWFLMLQQVKVRKQSEAWENNLSCITLQRLKIKIWV